MSSPESTFETTLDDIHKDSFNEDWVYNSVANDEIYVSSFDWEKARPAILQAHKEAVEAIIGDDEKTPKPDVDALTYSPEAWQEVCDIQARNNLRADQRRRLKEVSSPTNEEDQRSGDE